VGAAYGFRRSLAYTAGLIVGTIAVLVCVAAGLTTLLLQVPVAGLLLLSASGLYMLWLAFKIATTAPLEAGRSDAPAPVFAGGFLLAIANPKAFVAIAAVFAGTRIVGDDQADAITKCVILALMIVVIHLSWLLAGSSLSRVLQHPRASRLVNMAMAGALVAVTIVTAVSQIH
jgi:threonine/homoserine/homoserine lactone efflux protein